MLNRVPTFLVGALSATASAAEPVSFEKQVAPVLVEQCLVCHNTRTAKGRFNVETYASLMKGGESGPAIIAKDADSSNLWLLVDSGDMPKDGDPLPADKLVATEAVDQRGSPHR